MNPRLATALLVLLGPTAFAPAPFPKNARPGSEPEVSLKSLQGRWRIVSIYRTHSDGGLQREEASTVTHVRVRGSRWVFLPLHDTDYRLEVAIDHAKRPAQLTFYQPGAAKKTPYGVGLIRRQGSQIQILYNWGGEGVRPKAFDPAPDDFFLMTLERES
jgi:uncharacterized protein (TIGR03067 family)